MDDDLVDEFEEEEQAKAYSSEKISVGDEVEVKNVDDGFENSWSEAVIKKKVRAGGGIGIRVTARIRGPGH